MVKTDGSDVINLLHFFIFLNRSLRHYIIGLSGAKQKDTLKMSTFVVLLCTMHNIQGVSFKNRK